MNNKTLGTIAMVAAPAMLIGAYLEIIFPHLKESWFTGLWGLLYITPWMGMMVAMSRAAVLGNSSLGKAMPFVLLLTLTLADISNLMLLFGTKRSQPYFFYIDLFWPISHLLMLVVGVLAIKAAKLQGWQRYMPLAMGTWLPFALGTLALLGSTQTAFFVGGLYNAIVVTMLAWVVRGLSDQNHTPVGPVQKFQPVLH